MTKTIYRYNKAKRSRRCPLSTIQSQFDSAMSTSSSKKRPAPSSDDDAPIISRDALMDSLPYIDPAHEDYEQYALALIEEEMKNSKPQAEKPLPAIQFRTPMMELEYQRYVVSDGQPEPIQLPKSLSRAHPPDSDDVEAWKSAVQQAKSEYESERARSIALEVKKDSGAALLWKGFNGNLDKDLESLQKALDEQRQRVERINLQRSEDQQKAGKQLHILTTQYQDALERGFRLDVATTALEMEVSQLS